MSILWFKGIRNLVKLHLHLHQKGVSLKACKRSINGSGNDLCFKADLAGYGDLINNGNSGNLSPKNTGIANYFTIKCNQTLQKLTQQKEISITDNPSWPDTTTTSSSDFFKVFGNIAVNHNLLKSSKKAIFIIVISQSEIKGSGSQFVACIRSFFQQFRNLQQIRKEIFQASYLVVSQGMWNLKDLCSTLENLKGFKDSQLVEYKEVYQEFLDHIISNKKIITFQAPKSLNQTVSQKQKSYLKQILTKTAPFYQVLKTDLQPCVQDDLKRLKAAKNGEERFQEVFRWINQRVNLFFGQEVLERTLMPMIEHALIQNSVEVEVKEVKRIVQEYQWYNSQQQPTNTTTTATAYKQPKQLKQTRKQTIETLLSIPSSDQKSFKGLPKSRSKSKNASNNLDQFQTLDTIKNIYSLFNSEEVNNITSSLKDTLYLKRLMMKILKHLLRLMKKGQQFDNFVKFGYVIYRVMEEAWFFLEISHVISGVVPIVDIVNTSSSSSKSSSGPKELIEKFQKIQINYKIKDFLQTVIDTCLNKIKSEDFFEQFGLDNSKPYQLVQVYIAMNLVIPPIPITKQHYCYSVFVSNNSSAQHHHNNNNNSSPTMEALQSQYKKMLELLTSVLKIIPNVSSLVMKKAQVLIRLAQVCCCDFSNFEDKKGKNTNSNGNSNNNDFQSTAMYAAECIQLLDENMPFVVVPSLNPQINGVNNNEIKYKNNDLVHLEKTISQQSSLYKGLSKCDQNHQNPQTIIDFNVKARKLLGKALQAQGQRYLSDNRKVMNWVIMNGMSSMSISTSGSGKEKEAASINHNSINGTGNSNNGNTQQPSSTAIWHDPQQILKCFENAIAVFDSINSQKACSSIYDVIINQLLPFLSFQASSSSLSLPSSPHYDLDVHFMGKKKQFLKRKSQNYKKYGQIYKSLECLELAMQFIQDQFERNQLAKEISEVIENKDEILLKYQRWVVSRKPYTKVPNSIIRENQISQRFEGIGQDQSFFSNVEDQRRFFLA